MLLLVYVGACFAQSLADTDVASEPPPAIALPADPETVPVPPKDPPPPPPAMVKQAEALEKIVEALTKIHPEVVAEAQHEEDELTCAEALKQETYTPGIVQCIRVAVEHGIEPDVDAVVAHTLEAHPNIADQHTEEFWTQIIDTGMGEYQAQLEAAEAL